MIKRKKLKIALSISLIVIVITLIAVKTYSIWDEKMRRADEVYGGFAFDGMEYVSINYQEIGDYSETDKVVCKTKDGGWVLYEIKEYPNHEYLVARFGWDAHIIKRVS